jgi:hypothetical protein
MYPTGTDESDYRLDSLRRQLRHGWKIDAPVFGRDAYLSPAGRVRAVEFVLSDATGRQVIAIPDGPSVRDFLHQYGLSVVEL